MRTPAVERTLLVRLAGAVWTIVGLALVSAAILWFARSRGQIVPWVLLGLAGGILFHRLKFSRLAAANLERIFTQAPGKAKVCVFAFQGLKSYLIVVVMMFMGFWLRHSAIPRLYLAPLYLAIGLGLFLSSLIYYRRRAPERA